MRDFPPPVSTFHTLPGEPPTPAPDLRSPARFLVWLVRQQGAVLPAAVAVGVLWQLPLTLGPWLVGRAIDEGILAGSVAAVWRWTALLLLVTLVGAGGGILMHTLVVRSWLIALYGTTLDGHPQGRPSSATCSPDAPPPARCSAWRRATPTSSAAAPRSPPRALSQLVALLAVAAIVLPSSAPARPPGGSPPPRCIVGAALPLLRPLHRRQEVRAATLLGPHLAGHRHRRRPPDPARHRRRADLGPAGPQCQLTRRAGVAGGQLWQAATEALGRVALRRLPRPPHGRRHPGRGRRRCGGRSVSW